MQEKSVTATKASKQKDAPKEVVFVLDYDREAVYLKLERHLAYGAGAPARRPSSSVAPERPWRGSHGVP